jgi:hypothetical protein
MSEWVHLFRDSQSIERGECANSVCGCYHWMLGWKFRLAWGRCFGDVGLGLVRWCWAIFFLLEVKENWRERWLHALKILLSNDGLLNAIAVLEKLDSSLRILLGMQELNKILFVHLETSSEIMIQSSILFVLQWRDRNQIWKSESCSLTIEPDEAISELEREK